MKTNPATPITRTYNRGTIHEFNVTSRTRTRGAVIGTRANPAVTARGPRPNTFYKQKRNAVSYS